MMVTGWTTFNESTSAMALATARLLLITKCSTGPSF